MPDSSDDLPRRFPPWFMGPEDDYLPDDWIHDDPISLETLIKLAEQNNHDLGFNLEDAELFKQGLVSQGLARWLWCMTEIVGGYDSLHDERARLEHVILGLETRLARLGERKTEPLGINPNSDEGAVAQVILELWGLDGPPPQLKGGGFSKLSLRSWKKIRVGRKTRQSAYSPTRSVVVASWLRKSESESEGRKNKGSCLRLIRPARRAKRGVERWAAEVKPPRPNVVATL